MNFHLLLDTTRSSIKVFVPVYEVVDCSQSTVIWFGCRVAASILIGVFVGVRKAFDAPSSIEILKNLGRCAYSFASASEVARTAAMILEIPVLFSVKICSMMFRVPKESYARSSSLLYLWELLSVVRGANGGYLR